MYGLHTLRSSMETVYHASTNQIECQVSCTTLVYFPFCELIGFRSTDSTLTVYIRPL